MNKYLVQQEISQEYGLMKGQFKQAILDACSNGDNEEACKLIDELVKRSFNLGQENTFNSLRALILSKGELV